MATLLSISEYGETKLKEICKLLTLIPVDKEAEDKKKYMFGKSKIPEKKIEHIPMFMVDYIDGKSYLRIPFRFGCGLLGKLVNRDREYPKIDYNFSATLRDYQISVVQEAYSQLYSYGTTTLALPTGFGKSIISTYLASLVKCKICVIISLQTLIPSWYSTFLSCFPDKKDKIWVVGEGKMPSDACIFICMDQRVEKIPEKETIGCVLYDEIHLLSTQSRCPMFLGLQPKYIIACSATPEKVDGTHIIAQTVVGTHLVERLSEKPFKYYRVNTHIKIPEQMGSQGMLNFSALVNDQADCMERNIMAINIIAGNLEKHKFFVFTKTKAHCENIAKLCSHYGLEHDTLYGTKKKFEDKKILIASQQKAGVGFDYQNFLGEAFTGEQPDVLILMTSIKSISKLKQILGRVLRSSNPIFIFLCDNNQVFKKHYRETKQMFIDAKATIKEVDYDSTVRGGGVNLEE
jgi:superfamily II DNA or RNA helicase